MSWSTPSCPDPPRLTVVWPILSLASWARGDQPCIEKSLTRSCGSKEMKETSSAAIILRKRYSTSSGEVHDNDLHSKKQVSFNIHKYCFVHERISLYFLKFTWIYLNSRFSRNAWPTDQWTDGPTHGRTKPLIEFATKKWSNTLFLFYKNHVYKNVEAQISKKLRTC